MATGLVYHPDYLNHDTGAMHPECPERLRAVLTHLDRIGLRQGLTQVTPKVAESIWLSQVHGARHLQQVEQAAAMALIDTVYLDPDTPVSAGSHTAALKAAGGVMAAVDQVMAGGLDNAFCLVRPPGHHAEPDRVMGFCLYNSVAIAARYLQRQHGIGRVLIVDWDVHHGNGTQAVFWNDPTVLYFSSHQYPHYPGSGAASERGGEAALGSTLNCPLSAGAGDSDMLSIFEDKLVPAAEAFGPEFILISAGFDAHRDDPLASLQVSSDGFGRLTSVVKRLADTHCEGRLVSVLEGGYDLDALGRSAASHLSILAAA